MKEIDTLRIALLNARTRFLHLAMQNAEWKNCAESHVREIDAALEQFGVKRFDEKAFDEAVSRPNDWDAVPDPVAEIRRMRGDDASNSIAVLHSMLTNCRRDLDALEQACEKVLDADTLKAVQEAKKRIKDLEARQESTI